MKNAVSIVLRGIGQVMFQNNAMSGLIMLAGIAAGDWMAAVLALAGNIAGNLTAVLCGFRKDDIRNGLYGFNGTLVGIAVRVFFRLTGWSPLLVLSGAALSTLLANLFSVLKKPGYTAPFIISTWLLLTVSLISPSLRSVPSGIVNISHPDISSALSFGFGQVMFQGTTVVSGILFFIGIFINDRKAAFYSLWGAAVPLATGFFISEYGGFNAGLYGYNAVLCAIALAGSSVRSFAAATVSILLSVVMQWAGMEAGLVTLTAPFVLSVWMVLLFSKQKQVYE